MEQKELKRIKWNSWMFIVSYAFMGILSGVAFDVLVTFLQEVSPSTATSFSTWMGLSTFIGAGMLLIAPKLGYKKTIFIAPIICIVSLFGISYSNVDLIFPIATLAFITGFGFYDVMLAPMLNAYTTKENRHKTFSRALYINVSGMVIASWAGGPFIVYRFASKIGKTYEKAKELTATFETLKASSSLYNAYIAAHRDVFLVSIILCILSLIPLLFIKELPIDYREENKDTEKKKFDWSIFKNKYVVSFVIYYALIRFGASLIVPYFSVYLTKFIGIDRATTSTLVGATNLAMVIFMVVSPWFVKKFGQVVALGGLSLVSIPFMMIIANGKIFGSSAVIVVGLALFLRSGFMNAANPIMMSLPMEFVSKELRPAYNSVIFAAGGITSILAGQFTRNILFKTQSGYATAYYITAVIYTVASVLLLVSCTKKYNRSHEVGKEEKGA
ncbi:MFS transporter [Tepidibacter thalassicus]|nr:MFS transporter [Tepidibacter thalassicus]